jgi:DNA-binding NtrC family response regulator
LINGDLEGCAESLRAASNLSVELAQSRSTWHRAWNLRTEVRLLQRRGCWQESLLLIRGAEPRESSESRSFTKAQIESLEALALVKLGKVQEARVVLQRYLQESLIASSSYRGSILPTAAALSAVANGDALAVSQCVQALRIIGATGEASTLVEIVEQLIRLLSQYTDRVEESPDSDFERPLWRPTRIVCHLDASSQLLSGPGSEFNELVAFVGSLTDLTPDPLALGEEALRCMASMAWIRYGSVVQTVDGESRKVVSYDADVAKRRSEIAFDTVSQERITVRLGSKQSGGYELHVTPQESGQAIAACHGIARLLASLCGGRGAQLREGRSSGTDQRTLETDDSQGVFRSSAMLALLASAKRVAPLGITVLLTGESGTGKEVIADIIHRASGAPHDAYLAFNCATVPRDMVDSQLFGYRRGAFTGAAQEFRGVISAADGGTLLLDEVGELPLETQPKLLRFLDSGEVQALGEATPRRLRVRVIAATNADLEGLVRLGRFREDLYYRLNVVRFRLPPLRERREEILPLVSMFLAKYSSEFGKHNISLTDAAREHLLLYSWPGNVRQLSHEVRRLVALSDSDSVIDVHDLDTGLHGKREEISVPPVPGSRCLTVRVDRTLSETIGQVERAAIADAMEATQGRLDLAARRLGLSRKGLYLKRQRLGLP